MDAPQDLVTRPRVRTGCPLALLDRQDEGAGDPLCELTVPLAVGSVTLQVLRAGHRVTVDGEPVETLAALPGAPPLFPPGCTHGEAVHRFDAAGRGWRLVAKLRTHSAVSLGYVADQLRARVPSTGVLLERPGRGDALTALVAGRDGWTSWHLHPVGDAGALLVQTATSAVA